MNSVVDFSISKDKQPKRRVISLFCYVALGLLIVLLFFGKSRLDIETIAVSSDEQYIACFETGNGHKIHCFRANGSLAFDFDILSDISDGGYCTLWFEEDVLCVLFYRTGKIAYFSMDGTMLEIVDNATMENPPKFPSFSRKGNQYVFDGNKIDVVYEKGSFWGYWLLGAKRYLAIIYPNGDTNNIYSWSAKDGILEPIKLC